VQRRSKQVQPDLGPEKAFGQALRAVREQRGISQEALALESGFDRTYVSLLERGIQSPTVRNLVRLATVLRVRPSAMIRRMERLLESGPKLPDANAGRQAAVNNPAPAEVPTAPAKSRARRT